ncbi:type II secretion system ATPase GspE [bacterium]|nr:type II secretion system ATPase GspE [bacterium]
MVKSLRKRLNEILIEGGLITEAQLEQALKIQRKKGGRLGQVLAEEGYVNETDLVACLAAELSIPPINLNKYQIDEEIVNLIPEHVARHYQLLPLSKIGKTLTVAMADPLNVFAMDDIKILTGYRIEPIICTEKDIKEAIDRYYGSREKMGDILKEIGAEAVPPSGEEEMDSHELLKETEEAPVVKIVNFILLEAMGQRASDIHIEPQRECLKVRYRVDGLLQEMVSPPKKIEKAILARLKIMSGLDIAEKRVPQDGRFRAKLRGKEIDYRVSSLPISFGEKIVLRALDKSSLTVGLDKLGFEEEPLRDFERCINKPYGMILVTGPTGSGKSTTLYSVLSRLNTSERNIITVEDPVEYQVEGITQIQANPDIGLTFAAGLRSLLRQSPDIIMIGEIRDRETADIAVKAALTGQLVLSTLHTNDAAGAITRLIDMGVEPFLVSSSLIGAAAQRLVRKICPECKEPYKLPPAIQEKMKLENPTVYRGKGCSKCRQTGYHGRVAVLEVLVINEEIRDMIVKGASSDEIREKGRQAGMKLLRDSGMEKMKAGITSLEEVLRVT